MADQMTLIGAGKRFIDELYRMVQDNPMFDDLNGQEIAALANFMKAYEAKKNTVIMNEGETEGHMCMLLQGRLEVHKQDETGHSKKLSIVRPGKSIGEMSLIDGMPHSATVIAAEDSKLLLISSDNFRNYLDKHPEAGLRLVLKIARLMSMRLRQTSGILVDYLSE